jgi:hypothetical protein
VAAPRGVTYFRRRIRFGMCAVGVGIGLLAFAAPLVLSIARNRTLGLTLGPASPTSALVASLRNREESAGYVALIEAERRVRAGEVPVADLDQLVDAILAWSESNDSNYLETNAESVIAAAKAKGIDVDTRLLALADTLLGAPLSDVPESVREGVDRELPLRLPGVAVGGLARTDARGCNVDGRRRAPSSSGRGASTSGPASMRSKSGSPAPSRSWADRRRASPSRCRSTGRFGRRLRVVPAGRAADPADLRRRGVRADRAGVRLGAGRRHRLRLVERPLRRPGGHRRRPQRRSLEPARPCRPAARSPWPTTSCS